MERYSLTGQIPQRAVAPTEEEEEEEKGNVYCIRIFGKHEGM
jgi:hypothetical protein